MVWVQLYSLVRSKKHVTACTMGPKCEDRIHGPGAPSVPKAKLGYSVCVCHGVLIFRKLYTCVGYNYFPWLGPKDTEPRAPLVPKAKLGHSVFVRHGLLIFRKLYTWVVLNYPSWLGPKDTELRAPLVP